MEHLYFFTASIFFAQHYLTEGWDGRVLFLNAFKYRCLPCIATSKLSLDTSKFIRIIGAGAQLAFHPTSTIIDVLNTKT